MALTVVDASVVIALLDPTDAHHDAASEAFRLIRHQRRSVVLLPASAYAEALVHPTKAGPESVATVRRFCMQQLRVEPLSPDIAEAAARLRATHDSLRLPDALVIATAEVGRADQLLTTDRRWKKYWQAVQVLAQLG